MKKLMSYVVLMGVLILMSACWVEGGPGGHRRHHDNGNHEGQQQGDNGHHGDHR